MPPKSLKDEPRKTKKTGNQPANKAQAQDTADTPESPAKRKKASGKKGPVTKAAEPVPVPCFLTAKNSVMVQGGDVKYTRDDEPATGKFYYVKRGNHNVICDKDGTEIHDKKKVLTYNDYFKALGHGEHPGHLIERARRIHLNLIFEDGEENAWKRKLPPCEDNEFMTIFRKAVDDNVKKNRNRREAKRRADATTSEPAVTDEDDGEEGEEEEEEAAAQEPTQKTKPKQQRKSKTPVTAKSQATNFVKSEEDTSSSRATALQTVKAVLTLFLAILQGTGEPTGKNLNAALEKAAENLPKQYKNAPNKTKVLNMNEDLSENPIYRNVGDTYLFQAFENQGKMIQGVITGDGEIPVKHQEITLGNKPSTSATPPSSETMARSAESGTKLDYEKAFGGDSEFQFDETMFRPTLFKQI